VCIRGKNERSEPPSQKRFLKFPVHLRVSVLCGKKRTKRAYSKVHPLFTTILRVSVLCGKITSEASTTSGKSERRECLLQEGLSAYSTTILRAPSCLRALVAKTSEASTTSGKKRAKRVHKKKDSLSEALSQQNNQKPPVAHRAPSRHLQKMSLIFQCADFRSTVVRPWQHFEIEIDAKC
jgi:hypothetical protein